MPLPEHLHPKTYWEERTELLEESVFRLISVLAQTSLPPQAVYAVQEHVNEWNRLLTDLTNSHPAPKGESNEV